MIVDQYDRRRTALYGVRDDRTDRHERPSSATVAHRIVPHQAVACVEVEHPEALMRPVAQSEAQVVQKLGPARQYRPFRHTRQKHVRNGRVEPLYVTRDGMRVAEGMLQP